MKYRAAIGCKNLPGHESGIETGEKTTLAMSTGMLTLISLTQQLSL
jgi:hypothetical protein